MARTGREPLLGGIGGSEENSVHPLPRTFLHKDKRVAFVHAGLLVVTLIGGFVFACTSSLFHLKQLSHLDDPSACPLPEDETLLMSAQPVPKTASFHTALSVFVWLAMTAGGCAALSALLVMLFMRSALFATWVVIASQAVVPAVAGMLLLYYGQVPAAVGLLLVAALASMFIYLWRSHITLSGELIRLASLALDARKGIAGVALLMQLLRVAAAALLSVCGVFALSSGKLVPNRQRLGIDPDSDECIASASGSEAGDDAVVVPCCEWQLPAVSKAEMVIAGVTLAWTLLLVAELKRFAISRVVIHWYQLRTTSALEGLRTAFTSGYGTCALSALVMWLAQSLKSVAETIRQEAGEQGGISGLCGTLLAPLADLMSSVFEAFTRFAIAYAAGNAEHLSGFMHASSEVRQLLSQNLMSAVSTYWFPPFVLNTFSVLLAAVHGCIVYFFASANATAAIVSGATAFAALKLVADVLVDAIDAVYIAYASENTNVWPEAAEVMHKLMLPAPAFPVRQEGSSLP